MRIYTHIVFVFLLLVVGNYVWFHNTSGWDQLIPLLVGMVLVPLTVIMGLVQVGLEFKYPNRAMIMKYITKALTPMVALWAIYIAVSGKF